MADDSVISRLWAFSPTQFPLQVMRFPSHPVSHAKHRHEFTELVVILNGTAEHEVGRDIYTIETGDAFIILGDTKHAYHEPENLSLINVLMDIPRLGFPLADLRDLPGYHALFEVEPRVRRLGKFRNRLRLSMDQLSTVTRLIAELEEELIVRRSGCRFMAIARLMQLIGYLSRCYLHLEHDDIRPVSQISKLLGYMERHYAEPIAVADMMEAAAMSQTTLMRSFRRIMGRSPVDHLIRLRVAKAQDLLRHTDMPISTIARNVGFCDGNYLARQFRRVTGISPRQYRQLGDLTTYNR